MRYVDAKFFTAPVAKLMYAVLFFWCADVV
jgi:hypothetical protein